MANLSKNQKGYDTRITVFVTILWVSVFMKQTFSPDIFCVQCRDGRDTVRFAVYKFFIICLNYAKIRKFSGFLFIKEEPFLVENETKLNFVGNKYFSAQIPHAAG